MINLIVVLIVGAIIGWVASMIMRTGGGLLVDIVVGIVGALLASFLFGRATLTSGSFTVASLLWSLLGAVILLAIYKLLFRRRLFGCRCCCDSVGLVHRGPGGANANAGSSPGDGRPATSRNQMK